MFDLRLQLAYDRYLEPPRASSPMCLCEECNKELYEGEDVLDVHGEIYCEDCFYKMRRVLERID